MLVISLKAALYPLEKKRSGFIKLIVEAILPIMVRGKLCATRFSISIPCLPTLVNFYD
jgi:hypothetical protein